MAFLCVQGVVAAIIGPFTPFPINVIEHLFYFITRIPHPEEVKPPVKPEQQQISKEKKKL